jgi:hypothetical protein
MTMHKNWLYKCGFPFGETTGDYTLQRSYDEQHWRCLLVQRPSKFTFLQILISENKHAWLPCNSIRPQLVEQECMITVRVARGAKWTDQKVSLSILNPPVSPYMEVATHSVLIKGKTTSTLRFNFNSLWGKRLENYHCQRGSGHFSKVCQKHFY